MSHMKKTSIFILISMILLSGCSISTEKHPPTKEVHTEHQDIKRITNDQLPKELDKFIKALNEHNTKFFYLSAPYIEINQIDSKLRESIAQSNKINPDDVKQILHLLGMIQTNIVSSKTSIQNTSKQAEDLKSRINLMKDSQHKDSALKFMDDTIHNLNTQKKYLENAVKIVPIDKTFYETFLQNGYSKRPLEYQQLANQDRELLTLAKQEVMNLNAYWKQINKTIFLRKNEQVIFVFV
ncbi:hypothetical protein [Shimazuella kribbensis]|uniref:hypothetical protein n=1 Tax=Shimazuella kribbensis TaxID=139808 RepID=UPI0004231C27|nr:hypothetical protein [Shimazuella kribbensis]